MDRCKVSLAVLMSPQSHLSDRHVAIFLRCRKTESRTPEQNGSAGASLTSAIISHNHKPRRYFPKRKKEAKPKTCLENRNQCTGKGHVLKVNALISVTDLLSVFTCKSN